MKFCAAARLTRKLGVTGLRPSVSSSTWSACSRRSMSRSSVSRSESTSRSSCGSEQGEVMAQGFPPKTPSDFSPPSARFAPGTDRTAESLSFQNPSKVSSSTAPLEICICARRLRECRWESSECFVIKICVFKICLLQFWSVALKNIYLYLKVGWNVWVQNFLKRWIFRCSCRL